MTPTEPEPTLKLFVTGLPKPAGSKRAFVVNRKGDGKPMAVITDDCKTSRDWKTTVSYEAKAAMQGRPPIQGPVSLSLTFFMPRPKGHFGTGRNAATLRSDSPACHIIKPDTLKLTRAVEDALSHIAYLDDAQIVDEHLSKRYTAGTEAPGVRIEVSPFIPLSQYQIGPFQPSDETRMLAALT